MTTRTKVLGFAGVLAVAFVAAFGFGRLLGDDDGPAYRLSLRTAPSSAGTVVRFEVRNAADDPVTDFAVRHERKLHLIAVSDDFAGFRHLHPTMASDGTWEVNADLAGGDWRLYADFQPVGASPQVLHQDVRVAGMRVSVVGDGSGDGRSATTEDREYVGRVAGDLVAGETSRLTFTISRGDQPVVALEPYLGANGHLVAIRASNRAYLHVHPEVGPVGPTVSFAVEVPEPGRYHLYLDFKVGGVVRTAAFTLDATAGGGADHSGMDGMDHGDH